MQERIDITVRPSASLTSAELDEIWAVTDRYVETTRDVYERKLLAVPEVGLWRVRGGPLVGLVSLDVYRTTFHGRQSIIFFTSNVVIDSAHRGRNLVAKTGIRMLLREKLRRPWLPAYWLFDTFSYRSFLIIARNFQTHWPNRYAETPPDVAAFIDHLARQRYGDAWERSRGIVARSGSKRLRPATVPIDARAAADPDVQFYLRANPGHAEGDMLVCLAPLTASNVTAALRRAFLRR